MSYNGWSNYATWRVNLEVFDGLSFHSAVGHHIDTICQAIAAQEATSAARDAWYTTAQALEEHCNDIVDVVLETSKATTATTPNGVTWRDLVSGFAALGLSDVNWREIACHLLHDHADQLAEILTEEYDYREHEATQCVSNVLAHIEIEKPTA
jgi:hypothetical protein